VWNIFPHLGNRNEEDSRFLHNLLINIEITRIFSKPKLSPTYTCDIGQPISNHCDTTNQEHVIPIITILGTNHFCLKRIYQPVILSIVSRAWFTKLDQSRQQELGPGQKLVVYLIHQIHMLGYTIAFTNIYQLILIPRIANSFKMWF
jgi:hypothetical protein